MEGNLTLWLLPFHAMIKIACWMLQDLSICIILSNSFALVIGTGIFWAQLCRNERKGYTHCFNRHFVCHFAEPV